MQKVLRKENLLKNKHIPEVYFTSSYSQRLALLQGLMDSDGNGTQMNNYTLNRFTNTCESNLELLYWCCMNLEKSFCSYPETISAGNLENCNNDN